MMQPDKDYFLTGRILQKIYDSEIHLSLGWIWDGGVDYTIGKDLLYLHDDEVNSTGKTDISEAVRQIADEVAKEYPDSVFAKWWTDVREPDCTCLTGNGTTPADFCLKHAA